MTDKHHKDFNISVPTHSFNPVKNLFNTAGDFDYDYSSLVKYFVGLGDLKVTLSGEIDQTALNNGINEHDFAYVKSVRTSLWATLNKIGYNEGDSTYFNFLPVTNRINSVLADGTVIDVPIFLLGKGNGDPAKITINSGYVELKGQTILDTDHLPSVEIDISNNATYIIDKAFEISGTFNIDTGGFYFRGDASDNSSVKLTGNDGDPVTYQVNPSDVTYNNGNKAGITFNEEKVTNSTINLNNGIISTGDKGLIFLDYKNTLNLSGKSTINGNIVLGWDQNNINVNGNFLVNANANIIYSGSIDFKNYGFSGGGTVSVYGQYWDGKQFRLSQASIEGGTLGTFYIGYNDASLYEKGLGWVAGTSDPNAPQNNDPLYGGSLTISGNTTLDGTVNAWGYQGYKTTITLESGTKITLKDGSQGFVFNGTNGDFIVKDLVSFDTFKGYGNIQLGNNDYFKTLTVEGGNLTTSRGTVTGTNLSDSNGNLNFDNLKIRGSIDVENQGHLTANNLQCQNGNISVGNQGNITIGSGNINQINLKQSSVGNFSNIIINTFNSDSSSTESFSGNCTIEGNLDLGQNSTMDVSGVVNYGGSIITAGISASLPESQIDLNNGTMNFTNSNCSMFGNCIIGAQGGTFQVNNNGKLVVADQMVTINGNLSLAGSGEVDWYSPTVGSGSINVNSGVTLKLDRPADISPTINLNDGSTLEFTDYYTIKTSSINFVNKLGNQLTTVRIDDGFPQQGSYTIDQSITNVSRTDRIDFAGVKFSNENFKDATYTGGTLKVDYTDKGTTTTHEIDLTKISGGIFTEGETFKIIDDGHGGSEIDFSTGKAALNSSHLRSIFNGSSHNSALSNDMMKNIVDHHSSILKDFSSSLNTSKAMGELKGFGLTQTQPDHPSAFLNDNMLFRGENMGMHHDMLPQTGKLCA